MFNCGITCRTLHSMVIITSTSKLPYIATTIKNPHNVNKKVIYSYIIFIQGHMIFSFFYHIFMWYLIFTYQYKALPWLQLKLILIIFLRENGKNKIIMVIKIKRWKIPTVRLFSSYSSPLLDNGLLMFLKKISYIKIWEYSTVAQPRFKKIVKILLASREVKHITETLSS